MSENANNLLAELTGSDIQTDHGGLTFGDLVVLILDLVLLVYTGWRSYDFLTTTVPTGWETLALVGLWGLDIGAVAWSLVWIFGSTGKFQNWTALSFFVIDLVGVMLTSLTDSLMYSQGEAVMRSTLTSVTTMAVPIVMFGNVVAGFVYHMTSPETKARRKKREAEHQHREKMRQVNEMDQELIYAETYLLARQDMLDKAQLLAGIKIEQDALERQARMILRNRTSNLKPGNPNAASQAIQSLQERVGILGHTNHDGVVEDNSNSDEILGKDLKNFWEPVIDTGQTGPSISELQKLPVERVPQPEPVRGNGASPGDPT